MHGWGFARPCVLSEHTLVTMLIWNTQQHGPSRSSCTSQSLLTLVRAITSCTSCKVKILACAPRLPPPPPPPSGEWLGARLGCPKWVVSLVHSNLITFTRPSSPLFFPSKRGMPGNKAVQNPQVEVGWHLIVVGRLCQPV